MNKNDFLIELKSPTEYDYINGRVKVLETFLFSDETIKNMIKLPFDDILNELMNSHYREFISSRNLVGAINGISNFYENSLFEMEKFVSPGFINSFFRSRELFLNIKEFIISEESSESLGDGRENFIKNIKQRIYPEALRVLYEKLEEKDLSPFKINSYIDLYYIQFLLSSSKKTKSNFISGYYELYTNINTELILIRLLDFFRKGVVDEKIFDDFIVSVKEILHPSEVAKKIFSVKNVEDFEIYLRNEEMHYGSNEMFISNSDIFIKGKLREYLDDGKFINIGIEPVFVYLSKLFFEVEVVKKLLNAKTVSLANSQVLDLLGYIYE
jgi:vacuolar-type H+-ATPase subunit C/Vma6